MLSIVFPKKRTQERRSLLLPCRMYRAYGKEIQPLVLSRYGSTCLPLCSAQRAAIKKEIIFPRAHVVGAQDYWMPLPSGGGGEILSVALKQEWIASQIEILVWLLELQMQSKAAILFLSLLPRSGKLSPLWNITHVVSSSNEKSPASAADSGPGAGPGLVGNIYLHGYLKKDIAFI